MIVVSPVTPSPQQPGRQESWVAREDTAPQGPTGAVQVPALLKQLGLSIPFSPPPPLHLPTPPYKSGPELDQHQVLFLSQGLSGNLELDVLTTLASQQAPEITFLCFPSPRVAGSHPCTQFFLCECCGPKLRSSRLLCRLFSQPIRLFSPGSAFVRHLVQWLASGSANSY